MKRERNINYRAAENQPREADDRIKYLYGTHLKSLDKKKFAKVVQRWIKTHPLHHNQLRDYEANLAKSRPNKKDKCLANTAYHRVRVLKY